MSYFRVVVFAALEVTFFAGQSRGAEPDLAAQDEQVLRAANVGTDGPALVEFFRKRVGTEAARARARELVKLLGDDSFDVREKASADLVALGRVAMPALREALKDRDAEVARRAADCLRLVESDAGPALASAALRRLAAHKPAGAAAVLLDYLPCADSENLAEEVREALPSLAVRDGKADPALVKALVDELPLRRAAAAEALCRADARDQCDALLKLLQDRDAGVRLRVAVGFLTTKERRAVPVLIDLLRDLPRERGWEAEEMLRYLAGDAAPAVALDDGAEARAACREAWLAWWKKDGDKLDLTKFDPSQAMLGHLLAVIAENNCTLYEFGRDGKPLWEIPRLDNSVDARVLPGSRVLIAEMGPNRVTERDFKGNILWEKKLPESPYCAQRMPGGRTFIATRSRIVEVDRDGKEVFTLNVQSRAAHKFPDGTIALLGDDKFYRRYDSSGKELSKVQIEYNRSNTVGGVEFLPNGRIIVDMGNAIREYDGAGKKVWEASVGQADGIQRLPGGNTLVASMQEHRIVELDRAGKVVWERKFDQRRPWLARRR
jgi:hypothetical protein